MSMSSTSTDTVSSLDKLLRGERSAVATYTQAATQLKGEHASVIEENRACHAKRVDVLINRISLLGGQPTVEGGMWVGFTKGVEKTASIFGNDMIISALEQGEDIGLDDYKGVLEQQLDPDSRSMILRDLLPAQERTHQRMSVLKRAT